MLSFRMYIIHMYACQTRSRLSSSSPTAVQCFGRLSLCFSAVLCGFTAECWDASLQCCEAEAFRSLTTLQWSIPTQCSVGMLHCRVLGSLIVVLLRLHCSVLWCLTAECCEASLQSVVEASCRVLQCLTAECCWGLTAVCCDASLQSVVEASL